MKNEKRKVGMKVYLLLFFFYRLASTFSKVSAGLWLSKTETNVHRGNYYWYSSLA